MQLSPKATARDVEVLERRSHYWCYSVLCYTLVYLTKGTSRIRCCTASYMRELPRTSIMVLKGMLGRRVFFEKLVVEVNAGYVTLPAYKYCVIGQCCRVLLFPFR